MKRKISEVKMFAILTKLLSKEKLSELERQSIYKDQEGTYNLFGTYLIRPAGYVFVLTKKNTHTEIDFTDLKNAVTWATFDHINNINSARKVLELDMKLTGAVENVKIYEGLCRKTKNIDTKIIYLSKLQENRIKRNTILSELESHIGKAKEWQYKQFEINSSKYSKQ
jgi:hypothetical protein